MRRNQNVKISQKRTGVKWAKKKSGKIGICRRVLKDSKDVAAKSKPLKVYSALHTEKQKQTIIKTPKTKTSKKTPQKTLTKKQPTKDNNNKNPQLQKEGNVKVCTLGEEKVI